MAHPAGAFSIPGSCAATDTSVSPDQGLQNSPDSFAVLWKQFKPVAQSHTPQQQATSSRAQLSRLVAHQSLRDLARCRLPPGNSMMKKETKPRQPAQKSCYWTDARPEGEWSRKDAQKRNKSAEYSACHDCQTSHPPHRCRAEDCRISVCQGCSRKWRSRFAASSAVSAEKLAQFDSGICLRCLAICGCKRCLSKPSLFASGGQPCFSEDQEVAFALHTLAVLKPHIDAFQAARSAELKAMSEECGSAVELQGVKTIPLKDRLQCDCCAAAISDVHRTCSNEQCGDFDMCIKCSLDARKQDKALECGQCHGALELARRFDASFDQAFDAIAQTLSKHRIQPGQEHIWKFLSNKANRQAISNAGPLQSKKKTAAAADFGDEDEETHQQLPWWKLDYGPDVDSASSPDKPARPGRQSLRRASLAGVDKSQGEARAEAGVADVEMAGEVEEALPSSGGSNDSSHTAAPAEDNTVPGPSMPQNLASSTVTVAPVQYSISRWLEQFIQIPQPILQAMSAAGLNTAEPAASLPVATAEDLLQKANASYKASKKVHKTFTKQLRRAIAQGRGQNAPQGAASPHGGADAPVHFFTAPALADAALAAAPAGPPAAAAAAAVPATAAGDPAAAAAPTAAADTTAPATAPTVAPAEAVQTAPTAQQASTADAAASKDKKKRTRAKPQALAKPAQDAMQPDAITAATAAADPVPHAPKELGPIPDAQKLLVSNRQGDADIVASNYLWRPDAADCAVNSGSRAACSRIFQQQFCQAGKPVLVQNIQNNFFWDPDTLQRATLDLKGMYGKRAHKDDRKVKTKEARPLTVIDMRDSADYSMKQADFFKAFRASGGKVQDSEELVMLKVKDYPPDAEFADVMPRHWQDFLECLPFPEYCHPQGFLNIASYLTLDLIKPDLGPKSYIATGRYEEKGEGDSVTRLHIDLSDAINVLCHMEPTTSSPNGAGAVWDIFQRCDVQALSDYLMKHCQEFSLCKKPLKPEDVNHAIHSQKFYLGAKHLAQLKQEYGVEPWHFEQQPGEGVFIPAGCPHQVRNLGSCVKVAVDFVLPESLNQAFRFAEEFCTMAKQEGFEKDADGNSVPVAPKDRQHTDKLQAELSMCLAAKHAVDMLQQQQAVKAEGAEGTAPAAETAAEKKAGRTSARVASKDSGNAPEKAPAKATGKRKQADHADEDAANEQSQAHRQVKPETLAALPRKKTRRSVASVHSGQQ